jgi:hypothetical protein
MSDEHRFGLRVDGPAHGNASASDSAGFDAATL